MNPLVAEVYPHCEWCWEKWDLGKFNSLNKCALRILALCQDSLYIQELYLHVTSKYSCFNFGTFCTVGGRRLLVTESLSWKDTISSHSESGTCVLSQHIGKKGDQLCMQVKRTYTAHIHLIRGMTGREQDWRLLFPKDVVSLLSILVIAHEIRRTKHTSHCPNNVFLSSNTLVLFQVASALSYPMLF